jgi:hypothetical protein
MKEIAAHREGRWAVVALLGLCALLGLILGRPGQVQADAAALATPVVGDDRAVAKAIDGLGSATILYVRHFTTAGDDPDLPCIEGQGHQSAWLSYTAGGHGLLVFDTNTDGTNYDTALAVWVEEPGGALRLVTCATGPNGAGRASADVAAQPGATYLFEVVALQEGAAWLKVWLHACSALPLPPQPPGQCAYPGPETLTEPACVVGIPIGRTP